MAQLAGEPMAHARSNSQYQKVPPIGQTIKQRKGSNGNQTGSSHRINNSARPTSSSRQKIKRINSAKSNQDKKAIGLTGNGGKKHQNKKVIIQ